jgi:hypothetical protein
VKAFPDDPIVKASWWGTAVFTVVSVAAAVDLDRFSTVAMAVDTALFLAGCVLFGVSFLRAVGRSRTDAIGIGGLYFLAGATATASVRTALLVPVAVEVVVALGTAFAHPYTNLAAGVLVPVYGVSLCGLWASKHGTFGPRSTETTERGDGTA